MKLEVPEGVDRWPDGEPVVVMRPIRADVTLALAKVALEHQSNDALKEAITGGPCKFMGFLSSASGKLMVVDPDGGDPIPLEAGDIFCAPEDLRQPD
jgi:hypothetical protein